MSKTNETTKLGPATLDDHATHAEIELDAVTGGTRAHSVINTRAVARPESFYPPGRAGAALLGWIVGEVIVTDPVIQGSLEPRSVPRVSSISSSLRPSSARYSF